VELDETLSLLGTLVDVISKVADLERARVFLCHRCDLILHVVELFHVFSDLLILLEHVLLNLNCQLVQRALGWVFQALPFEITDILRVRGAGSGIVRPVRQVALFLVSARVRLNLLNLLADSIELSIDSCSALVQLHQKVQRANLELGFIDVEIVDG